MRARTREMWTLVGVEKGAALPFWARMATRSLAEGSAEARQDVCTMIGLARELVDLGVSRHSISTLLDAGAALGAAERALTYGVPDAAERRVS